MLSCSWGNTCPSRAGNRQIHAQTKTEKDEIQSTLCLSVGNEVARFRGWIVGLLFVLSDALTDIREFSLRANSRVSVNVFSALYEGCSCFS